MVQIHIDLSDASCVSYYILCLFMSILKGAQICEGCANFSLECDMMIMRINCSAILRALCHIEMAGKVHLL